MKKIFLLTMVMCLLCLFGYSQNFAEQNVPSYQNYVQSRSSGSFSVAGYSQMGTGNIMYLTGSNRTLMFEISAFPSDTTSWVATVNCSRFIYCSFYRTDGTGEVHNFSYADSDWQKSMRGHMGNYTLVVWGDLENNPERNPRNVVVDFVFQYAPTSSWVNVEVRHYGTW